MSWTPEPWWDESGVAHAAAPEWTPEFHSCVHPVSNGNGEDEDCARACACVNACAGMMNPEKDVRDLKASRDFYRRRVATLQIEQARMRNPERTIVCDIIANAALLPDPDGKRYGGEQRMLFCPFCGSGDFDAIGLKIHLMACYCKVFEATPEIRR